MTKESNQEPNDQLDWEWCLGHDTAKKYSYENVYKMMIEGFLNGVFSASFRDGFLEELKRERMEQIKE